MANAALTNSHFRHFSPLPPHCEILIDAKYLGGLILRLTLTDDFPSDWLNQFLTRH